MSQTKPHITLTIIGNRKSTLLARLRSAALTLESPSVPSDAKLSIELKPTRLETERQTYTIYETTSYQDELKSLLGNAPLLDGLIWGAMTDLPSTEDKALLEIASKIGLRTVLVFLQPQPNDSEEDIESAEFILRSTMQRCQLNGNEALIVRDDIADNNARLEALDKHFSPKPRERDELFMPLAFPEFPPLEQSGVAFGRIEQGELRVGDQVSIVSSLAVRRATVTALSTYPSTERDLLQCSLSGVLQKDVNRSYLLCGADRKSSKIVLTSRCTALLYFFSPKTEGGVTVITKAEAQEEQERRRRNLRQVAGANGVPRMAEGITQCTLIFLRRQLQAKPVDVWALTEETLPSATRFKGHTANLYWKPRTEWAYEELQLDLVDALPLEEGLLFFFDGVAGRELRLAGFGVITSTERR